MLLRDTIAQWPPRTDTAAEATPSPPETSLSKDCFFAETPPNVCVELARLYGELSRWKTGVGVGDDDADADAEMRHSVAIAEAWLDHFETLVGEGVWRHAEAATATAAPRPPSPHLLGYLVLSAWRA